MWDGMHFPSVFMSYRPVARRLRCDTGDSAVTLGRPDSVKLAILLLGRLPGQDTCAESGIERAWTPLRFSQSEF